MKKLLLILLLSPLNFAFATAGIQDFAPVSHWDCDETSGVRYDANLTNTNDLTDNNTVLYSSSLRSNACDFERSNSEYLSITDASQAGLDVGSNASFSFWINLESLPSSGQIYTILSKITTVNNESYVLYFTNSAGTYQLGLQGSEDGTYGGAGTYWFTNWTPTSATWYHLVFTLEGTTDKTTWYVNGSQLVQSTTAYTVGSFYNGTSPFTIGADVGWNTGYFDGLIDEVSVFPSVLTADNVTTLYNNGTPLNYEHSTTTPTATTSLSEIEEIYYGDITFGIAILITLQFIMVAGFVYNRFPHNDSKKQT